jgi:DNA-binding CsgD family transcriptional regulator
VLLFAVRDGYANRLEEARLPELRLRGLDDADSERLLESVAPGLAPETRRRLLDVAEGNPLALVELPRALGAEEVDLPAFMAPLPLTERLERAFSERVSVLPGATRSLLLVAALDEGGGLDEMLAAATAIEGRPVTAGELAPAEATGLVVFADGGVRFRQPLVRAAVYRGALTTSRQAAHAALANAHAANPDRGVWHRAASRVGPDEQVASELEAAAARAARRGAPAVSAAALERAAQLTAAPSSRGNLLVRAAETEFELGRSEVAHRLLEEARPLELGRHDRARLTFLLEASADDGWSGPVRVASFAEIANEMTSVDEPELALKSLLTAAVGCWWGNPTQETRDLVVAAAERIPVAADDPALLAVLAFDVSLGFLGVAVDGLRAQGRLGLLAQALVSQSWAALHLGKESLALSAADEAARLARETGQARWAWAAQLAQATVLAERGNFDEADALVNEAEAALMPMGAQAMLALVQFARGRRAISHLGYSEGLNQLRRVLDPSDVAFHPFVGAWALPDLVDAAAHTGRTEDAAVYLEMLESLAAQTSIPFLGAMVAFSRPLVASDEDAEDLFSTALGRDLVNLPCYQSRLQLSYGRWLRRRRRVAQSRTPLRAARDGFDALAFFSLAESARSELRASGEASIRRTPDARDQLTPQELQIAHMAAAGLSNREIGERLYLSHRTVGSHLYRLFPKLGITSRSQLGTALNGPVLSRI